MLFFIYGSQVYLYLYICPTADIPRVGFELNRHRLHEGQGGADLDLLEFSNKVLLYQVRHRPSRFTRLAPRDVKFRGR